MRAFSASALLLFAAGCSAAKADPQPRIEPVKARLELHTVKHQGQVVVGAYVFDTELKHQVAPINAEDGKLRWLPIEDWAPSATPYPRSIHSGDVGLWLDGSCSIGFAITPLTFRPKYALQRKPGGFAVWQIVGWRDPSDVSKHAMWAGADARKCVWLTPQERDEKLRDRGAWDFFQRVTPDHFEETQFSSGPVEASVVPTFPRITDPTVGPCVPCVVGDSAACGGQAARCYQPDGASGGCCVQ